MDSDSLVELIVAQHNMHRHSESLCSKCISPVELVVAHHNMHRPSENLCPNGWLAVVPDVSSSRVYGGGCP
jgi:hypothetical protein